LGNNREESPRSPDADEVWTHAAQAVGNVPGLPLHVCKLKVAAPVIILRNIDPAHGLCNGTRLKITRLGNRVLDATIITGTIASRKVILWRIPMTSSVSGLPANLKRTQFPIKLAFAMTINKAQGQTLRHVGLDLRSPVFSYGQLYVALSRVSNSRNLSVLLPNPHCNEVTNVVYKEILD